MLDWIADTEKKLHSRLEAELIVSHLLGIRREQLFVIDDLEFPLLTANEFVERRSHGEPIAYILGQQQFYGRSFKVSSDVLIPRPETETLIEAVLPHLKGDLNCLDVGTGSGCIAITLSLEQPNCNWTAIDISEKAIAIAKENANELSASVNFLATDFEIFDRTNWDVIVSNPPYVNYGDSALEPNVAKWEPDIALYSSNGIAFIKNLIEKSKNLLNNGGILAFEFGYDQESIVRELLKNWDRVEIFNDLAKIPRAAIAWKPCS